MEVSKPITLKMLSKHLGLSPTTISMVLNNAPGAKTIAPATRQRVQDAAKRFKYRPNLHAHILGTRRRNSNGVKVSGGCNSEAYQASLEDQRQRMCELEEENAKLKRLVAELCLNKAFPKSLGLNPSDAN